MQKVTIIQKKVTINYAQYTNSFVRHTLPSGEVQDLEVIEFDESKPFNFEIALSDTEAPTLNFENLVVIKADKDDVFERMEQHLDYPAWLDWDNLTTFEKIQHLQPELEAYFNQVLV